MIVRIETVPGGYSRTINDILQQLAGGGAMVYATPADALRGAADLWELTNALNLDPEEVID